MPLSTILQRKEKEKEMKEEEREGERGERKEKEEERKRGREEDGREGEWILTSNNKNTSALQVSVQQRKCYFTNKD